MLEKISRTKRSPKNKSLLNKNIKSAKCSNSGKIIALEKTNKKPKKTSAVSVFKSGSSKLSVYQNDTKYLKEIDPYGSVPLTKSLTEVNLKGITNISTTPKVIPILEFVKPVSVSALSMTSDSNVIESTSDTSFSSLSTDIVSMKKSSSVYQCIIENSNSKLSDEKSIIKLCDTKQEIAETQELNSVEEKINSVEENSTDKPLNTEEPIVETDNPKVDEESQNEITQNNEIVFCIYEKSNTESSNTEEPKLADNCDDKDSDIPEVLRKQGTASNCSANGENNCPCNTMEAVEQVSKQITYCNRKTWITVDRMNELRKKAQEALKHNKTFTIRGCFFSIRNALTTRGWVEKLDVHRKHIPSGVCQVTYEDLAQTLPKRRPGETRRQYVIKCERNIMSRFLEHMPINFLWTARKEKCDYIDQAKNPSMIINKFARVPFTSKEGLCNQLKDFHWFYEEGTAELYFPRCYNAWSPEDLSDFVENFRTTACICFLKWLVDKYRQNANENCFSVNGKIPITAIDFARKRCNHYIDNCCHIDIDIDNDNDRIWDHDWDAFLTQYFILTQENAQILSDPNRNLESTIIGCEKILDEMQEYWPQYNLDGYLNLWIIKPANKCRGRGIQLTDNLKKIMHIVNPAITSKSRYVVQKYIERPLIIHNTKFDIRQWFMVTSVQPLIIWMYKESYLRFSTQDFNLTNHHESVHLTNHAIQKKYRINGKRDKRLPNENMWDCYSFQAYLRQIGKYNMWTERIYPGMRRAIIGSMLASQESMDRRSSTFELFGADFMISEDFYPWLIEINSSPDLGATTSVTARMCPQCLEDVIKVIIDKRLDPKSDTGNFELIYRQVIPPTPAYMGLNLFLKGKQILPRNNHHHNQQHHYHHYYRNKERSSTSVSINRQAMPRINFEGSPPRINTGGNPEICSVLQFMDKSSNCNPREFSSIQHNFTATINSNQIMRHSSTLDTSAGNTNTQQTARLLTPIIPALKQSQSVRTTGTQQLMLSPRGTLIGDRRRSNEITSLKNLEKKNKSNYTSPVGRHFSCGPRLSTSQSATFPIKNTGYNANDIQQENVVEDNGNLMKLQNKLNLDLPVENTTANTTENLLSPTTLQRNSTTNVCRKKIYEMLYKSKSAGRLSRSTKSSFSPSIKGSQFSSNIVNTNSNCSSSSAALLSYRKNCLLNRKNVQVSNSNGMAANNITIGSGIGGGNHTKERISFRAWRSKQLPQDISTTDIINGKSSCTTCKSAPITHLSPNKRRIENNGGCMITSNNSNIVLGTRQLCKNLNKKEYQKRMNTRC